MSKRKDILRALATGKVYRNGELVDIREVVTQAVERKSHGMIRSRIINLIQENNNAETPEYLPDLIRGLSEGYQNRDSLYRRAGIPLEAILDIAREEWSIHSTVK